VSETERDPVASDGAPEPNWRRLYVAVLLALVVEVVLFYVFTRAFA
jgi:hypothetical protein